MVATPLVNPADLSPRAAAVLRQAQVIWRGHPHRPAVLARIGGGGARASLTRSDATATRRTAGRRAGDATVRGGSFLLRRQRAARADEVLAWLAEGTTWRWSRAGPPLCPTRFPGGRRRGGGRRPVVPVPGRRRCWRRCRRWLPPDRFVFWGFPAQERSAPAPLRRRARAAVHLVLYEPRCAWGRRVDLVEVLGGGRALARARVTKPTRVVRGTRPSCLGVRGDPPARRGHRVIGRR